MGPLWDEVRKGPFDKLGNRDASRVVVVVNANDLRAEGIEVSRHLSWEKAAEDFVRQLGSNGRLDTLVTCANLIVRFDCDGVIHHRGRDQLPPILYFDPERAEGEFVESHLGQMIGLTTAFTAGLALGLVNEPDNIDNGIRLGFAASRRLAETGFRLNAEDGAPDYAFSEVMRDLKPDKRLASVEIPSGKISMGSSWSILEETMGEAAEVARHIVQIGPSAALERVPTATFARLITADRQEIENFRAITNLLHEYFRTPHTKPWCIGVFGPHGSGKAFAAMQVAERAAKGRSVVRLEYNLSQFTDGETLSAAFQTIRDHTLAGKLPMVFFNTFDAAFVGDSIIPNSCSESFNLLKLATLPWCCHENPSQPLANFYPGYQTWVASLFPQPNGKRKVLGSRERASTWKCSLLFYRKLILNICTIR
jgi:hypothetical protein